MTRTIPLILFDKVEYAIESTRKHYYSNNCNNDDKYSSVYEYCDNNFGLANAKFKREKKFGIVAEIN